MASNFTNLPNTLEIDKENIIKMSLDAFIAALL